MIKEYLNVVDNETKEFIKTNVLHNLNFPYFLNHTEMDEGDSKVTNKIMIFVFLLMRFYTGQKKNLIILLTQIYILLQ